MLTKHEIKYYSALLTKKFREQERKFLVEGERIVTDGLKSDYTCELVIKSKDFINEKLASEYKDIRFEEVSENDFKKVSDTKNPQGIAAVFLKPDLPPRLNSKLIVAMENISDPGNVGTILRTCDWFGIEDVILSDNSTDIYNPKTLRSGMGAVFHLNAFEDKDFYGTLKKLQSGDYEVMCADMSGENLFDLNLSKRSVLVVCNEANGPTPELLELIDKRITIPKLGQAESLNVAGASAIILSQLTKSN